MITFLGAVLLLNVHLQLLITTRQTSWEQLGLTERELQLKVFFQPAIISGSWSSVNETFRFVNHHLELRLGCTNIHSEIEIHLCCDSEFTATLTIAWAHNHHCTI